MIIPAVIFSMVHTFQTVQSVFVQSPPLSCIENQSDGHDDDNVELPSQFISFVVSTLTPFRKFLKHNQFNKSSGYLRYYGLDH